MYMKIHFIKGAMYTTTFELKIYLNTRHKDEQSHTNIASSEQVKRNSKFKTPNPDVKNVFMHEKID